MIEPGAKNFFIRIFWLLLLAGALTVMYQVWNLHSRDLSQNEGFYTALAAEINPAQPMCTAHGVGIKNNHFLLPLITNLLSRYISLPLSSILRYVNFFFLTATALLLSFTAGFTRDFKAGIIAAGFFCANLFIFLLSMYAETFMIGLFCLFAAQCAWIYFGFSKGHWNLAWVCSLFFVSCGFLAAGVKIPLYFFLPLFFMHRPLKLTSRLNKKGFAVGMIIFGIGIILRFWPFIFFSHQIKWDYMPLVYQGMGNFLLNIILEPLQMLLLLFPWTLLIWMPFCVAIRPLDKTPIFSHYFRVIFITGFVFTVFNPFSVFNDFIFTLPPLALLCALSYDTAVRRYSVEIRRMAILCGYITAFLAASLIIYCFFPAGEVAQYINLLPPEPNKDRIFSAIIAFMVISLWSYHYRKHGQIWLIMLFTAAAMGIFCQLTFIPFQNNDRSRSELGLAILKAINDDGGKQDAIIYKNNILDLYNESYYMKKTVIKINNFDDIDSKKNIIYLLTTDFPQYPERTWKNIFETTYRGQKLYLYRGETTKRKELINRRNNLSLATELK